MIHYTFIIDSCNIECNRMFHRSERFVNPAKTIGNQSVRITETCLYKYPAWYVTSSSTGCPDLPKAIGRLLRNPVFVFVLVGCCFNSYLVGFFTFLPKYLETYFGYSASFASILTGMSHQLQPTD